MSFRSLHPSNPAVIESMAFAVAATQQAGYIYTGGQGHAAVWHGTPESMVDLHPPGATASDARATDGVRQGGVAQYFVPGVGTQQRAVLWAGSAASMVSLNPGPQYASVLNGMSGDQQVGYYRSDTIPQTPHAALWRGTAASMIDLSPGEGYSELYATNGIAQVGVAGGIPTGGLPSASIWFGSAASWVNLGQFRPPEYGESVARAVTFENGQFYVAGYAYNLARGRNEAMLWVGVPTPATLMPMCVAGAWAARRRRRTRG